MNELLIDALLLTASLVIIFPALRTRRLWSGAQFTGAKFRTSLVYNLFFACCHWGYFKTGNVIFTDMGSESPLRLLSFFFAIAHTVCIPSEYEKRPWLRRKNSPKNMIINEYPNRSVTYADSFFYYVRVITMFTMAALFYSGLTTVGVKWIIERFTEFDPTYFKVIFILSFLFIAPIFFWGIRLHHRKHGRTL